MEAPSVRYILSRAALVLCLLVAVLYGMSFYKKHQRRSAIAAELKSIASDSSYFQQFYAEDARKSLLRAIGLIGEARQLGVPPDESIDRAVGITEIDYFTSEEDRKEPTPRQELVRQNLRLNWTNFLKLGYEPDFRTLQTFKEGRIPQIPGGPEGGKTAEVGTIIDPRVSPGLEKVIANLELRPPRSVNHRLTDIELAAAKKFAADLFSADLIEGPVKDKIIDKLSPPAADGE